MHLIFPKEYRWEGVGNVWKEGELQLVWSRGSLNHCSAVCAPQVCLMPHPNTNTNKTIVIVFATFYHDYAAQACLFLKLLIVLFFVWIEREGYKK